MTATTTRTFAKGDTVYTINDIGEARTVVQVRKASSREWDKDQHIKLSGGTRWTRDYRARHLVHADDLTPEQREEVAAYNRKQVEQADSTARLKARNAATIAAHRDKLDAAPVYGPVVVGDSKWRRESDTCKPIGSTFTYWTTEQDRHGVVSVVQRTDWCGVTVETAHRNDEWSWGVSIGGTTYTGEQVRVMADALTMALALIPTLGDPQPVYDRES